MDVLREEEVESRWEAAPAVAIVIALQVVLAATPQARREAASPLQQLAS